MAPFGNNYDATTATAQSYRTFYDGTADVIIRYNDTATYSNYSVSYSNVAYIFEYHHGRAFKKSDKKAIKNFLSAYKSKQTILELRETPYTVNKSKNVLFYRNIFTSPSPAQKAYRKRKAFKKKLGLKF